MEDHDPAPRRNPVSPPRTNPSHPFQFLWNERAQDNNHVVRQTYSSRSSNFTERRRSNFGNRAERYGMNSQLPRPEGLQNLNPNAPMCS